MTSGRRTLRHESFDEVMPDVERLPQGHTTVAARSLAPICNRLAAVLRRHGGPARLDAAGCVR